jgi:hypothetical protein
VSQEFDAAGPRATAERLDVAEEWPARKGGVTSLL